MNTFTAQAPTVDEAITEGLKTLGVSKNEVTIDILHEGKKGLFGFGKKDALVKLTKKTNETPLAIVNQANLTKETQEKNVSAVEPVKEATETVINTRDDEMAVKEVSLYLTNVTQQMNAPALVRVEREGAQVIFHLETEKDGFLIGKHGRTLNALQYLSQVLLHRRALNRLTAVVNVGDYRERRKASLKRLADQTANRVSHSQQPVFLEPMPAFERKIVHAYLSEDGRVQTHSEGKDPHRYLVVEPTKRF